MAKLGREFEESVYRFVASLDPQAKVIFDHKVLDRDSGTWRQCDVWIEARVAGHWPIAVLVSCKDKAQSRRRLDVSEIGTFVDEVRSTGATMGVIYSNVGFTKPALKKAGVNRISCCRLFTNEPSDIPGSVWLEYFLFDPTVQLVSCPDTNVPNLVTWDDVFRLQMVEGEAATVLDVLCRDFAESEEKTMREFINSQANQAKRRPPDWELECNYRDTETGELLHLGLRVAWKQYKAKAEATLLDGSYCLTDSSFVGSQYGPSIEFRAANPGDAWELVPAEEVSQVGNTVSVVRWKPDVRASLVAGLMGKRITGR